MMLKRMKIVSSFLRYNPNKRLFIKVLLLSGIYRICILTVPMKRLKTFMGTLNEESDQEETAERYRQVAKISNAVMRVCGHTPWKSKCFVRALTAQYLLKKKRIPSTLYLGVGVDGNDMKAHAWIRSGKCYLTGGSGEGYTVVAKFRA